MATLVQARQGHGPAALLVSPQSCWEELVAPHNLQSHPMGHRGVIAAGIRAVPAFCRLQEGNFGSAAFLGLGFCALVLSDVPKAAWGCCPFCTLLAE